MQSIRNGELGDFEVTYIPVSSERDIGSTDRDQLSDAQQAAVVEWSGTVELKSSVMLRVVAGLSGLRPNGRILDTVDCSVERWRNQTAGYKSRQEHRGDRSPDV